MSKFPEQLRSCGVVGAGGAGFPTHIKAQSQVEYLLANGAECEMTAEGVLATCLQHEIDHLDGILFIDHISKLKRDRILRKFKKDAKRKAEEKDEADGSRTVLA